VVPLWWDPFFASARTQGSRFGGAAEVSGSAATTGCVANEPLRTLSKGERPCTLTVPLPHSPAAPLALIGIAHLSISLSTNFCKYSGDRRWGATSSAPYSFIRA